MHHLGKCLRDSSLLLRKNRSQDDAKAEFKDIIWEFNSKTRTSRLNAWCDKFLGTEEWQRLHAAIHDMKLQSKRFRELKSELNSATD